MTKSFCTLFHQFWTWVAHPNPQSWASWNHICQPQLSLGLLKQKVWDWVLGNWRFLKLPKWVDSKVGLRIVEPWRSPGTCGICWHFSQWYSSLCRARLNSGPNQTNWYYQYIRSAKNNTKCVAVHASKHKEQNGTWSHFYWSTYTFGEGNGNPLQCSCLENPRDGGAWWAAIYGVAQNRTQLKRLSSSSSTFTFRRNWKGEKRKHSC